MGITNFFEGKHGMAQSGWRVRVGVWSLRARIIPIGVWLLSGISGIIGAVLIFWDVFLLVNGAEDQIGAS